MIWSAENTVNYFTSVSDNASTSVYEKKATKHIFSTLTLATPKCKTFQQR